MKILLMVDVLTSRIEDIQDLVHRPHPETTAHGIGCPDFVQLVDSEVEAEQIANAFVRTRQGELIEVGCVGGSGRTGTVLACMAILAGIPPSGAVAWVRAAYRAEAVETAAQE